MRYLIITYYILINSNVYSQNIDTISYYLVNIDSVEFKVHKGQKDFFIMKNSNIFVIKDVSETKFYFLKFQNNLLTCEGYYSISIGNYLFENKIVDYNMEVLHVGKFYDCKVTKKGIWLHYNSKNKGYFVNHETNNKKYFFKIKPKICLDWDCFDINKFDSIPNSIINK